MEVKEHYGTVHPLLAIITVPTLRMLESFVVCEEDSNASLNSLFFLFNCYNTSLENNFTASGKRQEHFQEYFQKRLIYHICVLNRLIMIKYFISCQDLVSWLAIQMVAVIKARMTARGYRNQKCVIVTQNVSSMETAVWTLTSFAGDHFVMEIAIRQTYEKINKQTNR